MKENGLRGNWRNAWLIRTPRGCFYVADMTVEQMEAAGYGVHHQSDDGKYLIMGNGKLAYAVPAQKREARNG